MNNSKNIEITPDIDYRIDISDDICPMTFVKTKLQLEKMASGEILEVRLTGKEPLYNVPRSCKRGGNIVVSLAPLNPEHTDDHAIHVLIIKKA